MKLLALDFDGVIADSAREAFRVALRTWAALRPESPLAASPAAALPGPAEEGTPDAPLYAAFLEIMPLGNRAEDYATALAALEADAALPDQDAYDAFKASLAPEFLRAFHGRFYRERAAWAETDPEGWRARMAPYAGIPELLRRRSGDVELAIATAKDRHSVRRLLEGYGVADLFPEGSVLDKETGVSKRTHVERLAADRDLAPAEITFVDDKVNHLETVAPLGARCVLAAWGYNGPREHRLARRAGFRVCGLEELEACLFEEGEKGPGPAER